MSLGSRLQDFKYRMAEQYRFIVQHKETYEEVRNQTLTLGRFLTYVMLSVIGVIAVTALIIFFTPVREWIPGYTDTDMREKQAEVINKALLLEKKIAEQDSFIKSLTGIAEAGKSKTVPDNTPTPTTSNTPETTTENPANVPDIRPTEAGTESRPVRKGRIFSFITPVDGFLTGNFKPDEKHFAVDIAAPQNSSIRSVADGYVLFSDYTTKTGHVIGIAHADNFISFYKHNRSVFKKTGSRVFAGEVIATIGNSGENSTGPHLHFELWKDGKPVDPAVYMNLKNR